LIVLDTNVISELSRPKPAPDVIEWLDRQPRSSIWTTSITVFEVRFGLQLLPKSKRRLLLTSAFEGVIESMEHRIVSFDAAAASETATLMASRQQRGKPGDLRDSMIAGIVLAHHATLATRNTSHFEDLSFEVVNPWTVR
jgi:toxin FitB